MNHESSKEWKVQGQWEMLSRRQKKRQRRPQLPMIPYSHLRVWRCTTTFFCMCCDLTLIGRLLLCLISPWIVQTNLFFEQGFLWQWRCFGFFYFRLRATLSRLQWINCQKNGDSKANERSRDQKTTWQEGRLWWGLHAATFSFGDGQ